jgi:hypothetical protein
MSKICYSVALRGHDDFVASRSPSGGAGGGRRGNDRQNWQTTMVERALSGDGEIQSPHRHGNHKEPNWFRAAPLQEIHLSQFLLENIEWNASECTEVMICSNVGHRDIDAFTLPGQVIVVCDFPTTSVQIHDLFPYYYCLDPSVNQYLLSFLSAQG